MKKELVIGVNNDAIAIALLEDQKLVEIHKDTLKASFAVGNIYLGRVKRVMQGLNAAFVDIGSSKEAFIHADYTLVVDTALTGRRLGAQHMLVVSAMGANAHSPFFYNRVKGEMEEALIAQNWPKLTIARPSMLLGDRSKQRMNETLFAPLFRLLPGNWKSIDARDVARVMLAESMRPEHEGVTILSSSELRKRAE